MTLQRQPEPERMDLPAEVAAYAQANFAEVNRRFVDRVLDLVGPADAPRCVDLGCGPGDITIRLAAARPMWRLTGVDASAPMLQWAARCAASADVGRGICWALGDVKSLPFDEGAFDIVVSNSLLHHITDAVALWRELKRIAKPGGMIFLRDLYRPADTAAARAIVDTHAAGESELLREEFYRSLLSAYSAAEIRAQLSDAGLAGLRVEMVNDRHIDVYGRAPGH